MELRKMPELFFLPRRQIKAVHERFLGMGDEKTCLRPGPVKPLKKGSGYFMKGEYPERRAIDLRMPGRRQRDLPWNLLQDAVPMKRAEEGNIRRLMR